MKDKNIDTLKIKIKNLDEAEELINELIAIIKKLENLELKITIE